MNKVKLYLSAVLAGGLIISCDSEADNLGLQFFEGAKGEIEAHDLVVYNVGNDAVRSDAYVLKEATLGAFSEATFGGQKSAYVTQIRMPSYAPNFGENAVVDSVVLELKPTYSIDAPKVTEKDLKYNGVDARQTLTAYSVAKYGKVDKPLTIKVKEVLTDLGKVGEEILSNKVVVEGRVLGTKSFNGNATSVEIKGISDEKVLLTKEVGVRIPLDKDFFQTKVVAKNGGNELATEEAFINYFKGLKLEVQENDGYFMTFVPNDITLKMYYTSGAIGSRKSEIYYFNLGASNVHFGQITSTKSSVLKEALARANKNTGDNLIYLQGLGGSGAGVKLTGTGLDALKKEYKEKGSVILSAKMRLYVDGSWNNTYAKPQNFLVKEQGTTDFISDLKAMVGNVNYRLVTAYTASAPEYYDIDITKTIKRIVEEGAQAKDLVINVGEYISLRGVLVSEAYNSSAYVPNRVVLVGTTSANTNKAKLLVTRVVK